MLFNSLEFAVFFPVVVGLYFSLPHRHRVALLLVSSCVFYMAFIPAYIAILGLTILIDYCAGIWLEKTENDRARRLLLLLSIIATCTVLFVFKYFFFAVDNTRWLAGIFGWHLTGPSIRIILPIGLSFHTFQSLSYVIEVFRRRQKAETNFVTYATYVMFFPQLVAGPIERPQNLLHQFYEVHEFDYARITSGLKRMAWGFFKKLVIADRLALLVNDVYAAPQAHSGFQLSLATVFFAYQIYCDFSGYSDIAIGSARVLGFTLMENFRSPYHAGSVGEFWQRWHISLSTWFRDYVYIPLGGSHVARWRSVRNVLIAFTISGLWHGANWTFVIWGFLNGLYLTFGSILRPYRERWWLSIGLRDGHPVRVAIGTGILFVLTCVTWVFFRASSVGDATYILTHFWADWRSPSVRTEQFLLRQFPVAVISILALEVGERLHGRVSLATVLAYRPVAFRWAVYTAFVIAVVLFGIHRSSQFIYFQF